MVLTEMLDLMTIPSCLRFSQRGDAAPTCNLLREGRKKLFIAQTFIPNSGLRDSRVS